MSLKPFDTALKLKFSSVSFISETDISNILLSAMYDDEIFPLSHTKLSVFTDINASGYVSAEGTISITDDCIGLSVVISKLYWAVSPEAKRLLLHDNSAVI